MPRKSSSKVETEAKPMMDKAEGVQLPLQPVPNVLKGALGILSTNLAGLVLQHPEIVIPGVDKQRFLKQSQELEARVAEIQEQRKPLEAKLAALDEEISQMQSEVYTPFAHALKIMDVFAEKNPRLAEALKHCRLQRAAPQRKQNKGGDAPTK